MSRVAQLRKSSEIAAYLVGVLQSITTSNGYLTDIGVRLMDGSRKIDRHHPPCIVLYEAEDTPSRESEGSTTVLITQRYLVGGYIECDPENPNVAARQMIKDIKKALWGPTQGADLGGRVKQFDYEGKDIGPRIDGEPIVYVTVEATAKFVESLGDA